MDLSLRPTNIEIDLDALEHNYRAVANHVAPAIVMPVVKANAYGHGLIECARVLEAAGAKHLAVAFLEEAITLRRAGITTRILTLGGLSGRQLEGFLQYDIDCTVPSVDKMERLERLASSSQKRFRVHLKIDTGMERIGVHDYSAVSLFTAAKNAAHCDVVGIYTHCPQAENLDLEYTQQQLQRFKSVLKMAEEFGFCSNKVMRHMANSGAICTLPESYFDVVRPGLLLYGYAPIPEWSSVLDLRPVLRLSSEVVYFKVIKKGAGVSYNHSWHTSEQTRVVTIPLGYGDGYTRAFSNKASVLLHAKRYPVVGNVCMDQLMVNIGLDSAFNGDEVVLLGKQGTEKICLHELAQWAGTDPREVLCALNSRIPRHYIGGET